jgi:hypothetical protein
MSPEAEPDPNANQSKQLWELWYHENWDRDLIAVKTAEYLSTNNADLYETNPGLAMAVLKMQKHAIENPARPVESELRCQIGKRVNDEINNLNAILDSHWGTFWLGKRGCRDVSREEFDWLVQSKVDELTLNPRPEPKKCRTEKPYSSRKITAAKAVEAVGQIVKELIDPSPPTPAV